ncbi:MAG TPA: WD40 repeat domain-containing protein [Pseudolabrys sp.]|nr:WD40 repeat domain-containing protein [Pseudolabrys sp.]
MTSTDMPLPSLADRVRAIDAGGESIVGAHFLGATPVLVLGEEALLFAALDAEPRRVEVHEGGILASAGDKDRIVTGGDDGNVVATGADGTSNVLAKDPKSRWIDQVALGPDGAVAWSAGKTAFVRTGKGEERSFEAPSTVAGLAFLPKGFRLAIAHYNGATLWFPNAQGAEPTRLEWKGSHLGITVSPDGRFLITTMQEPQLHGWRISDGQHMRMSGYSTRVRSLSWSADGAHLATSGSEQLILWPFDGKNGPMGRQPQILARDPARVAVVACHPKQPVVAVGYADGKVLLVRVEDGALISVREADNDPASALAWAADGQTLAFGTEGGKAGALVF